MINTILNENEITFNMLEEEIFKISLEIGRNMMKYFLEQYDKKITIERDKDKYRHKGTRQTTVKTIMGEVTFSRVVYKDVEEISGEKYIYLLDEKLGLETIGLMSTTLVKKMAENITIESYRNTAKNITMLTGQSISHGGVWNVIQSLGNKIGEDEINQVNKLKKNELRGEKEVPILFEEADGVWINIQGKDRPKTGRKLEMKVAVAYEAWKEVSNGRFEVVNKIACAGFESASDFYKKKEAMIAKEYNVDEIKMRILNGDGATWIQHGLDDTVHYQLDPFHKNKAVFRYVSDAEQRETILKFLSENNIEEALGYIDALANSVEDEKTEEKLRALYKYFNENKEGLKPYQARKLDIPNPPEGQVYRNLGTMEHNICDIIALRMKHRKASWSLEGAGNLAKLLTAKASKRLYEVVERISSVVLPEDMTCEIIEVLSSAKAPKKDGKGKDGGIHKGQIPFTNCAVTNGRSAIRKMFSERTFSDLNYI